MKRFFRAAAVLSYCLLIPLLVFGAGFFEQGQAPPGGYPSAPTFTHVGTGSLTATDNLAGTGATDLKNFRNAILTGTLSVTGLATLNGGAIGDNTDRLSGFNFGASGYTDNGFFNTNNASRGIFKLSPWVDVTHPAFGAVGDGEQRPAARDADAHDGDPGAVGG